MEKWKKVDENRHISSNAIIRHYDTEQHTSINETNQLELELLALCFHNHLANL